jgi:hypothetical protein
MFYPQPMSKLWSSSFCLILWVINKGQLLIMYCFPLIKICILILKDLVIYCNLDAIGSKNNYFHEKRNMQLGTLLLYHDSSHVTLGMRGHK